MPAKRRSNKADRMSDWKIIQMAPPYVRDIADVWEPKPGASALMAFYGYDNETVVIALWPPSEHGRKYWAVIKGTPA